MASGLDDLTERKRLLALLDRAIALSGGDAGAIYFLDPERQVLRQVLSRDIPAELRAVDLPLGHGVAGTAAATRQTQRIPHYPSHPLAREPFLSSGLQSVMEVPLLDGERVVGVLSVNSHREGFQFGERESAPVEQLAPQAALLLQVAFGGGARAAEGDAAR